MKITKMIISLMLMAGLAASSFAAGPAGKSQPKNVNNKVKIEQKAPKQNVKVVKVVKEAPHKHYVSKPHHKHQPKKEVVVVEKHYVNNSCNNNAAVACAAVLGVGLIAAAISGI